MILHISRGLKAASTLLTMFALLLLTTSCEPEPIAAPRGDIATEISLEKSNGPVVHHVSVGGPDACAALGEPQGCDANFSLTANVFANGTVKGQYNDQLKSDTGIHGTVDCVVIDGNSAIVGGVITQGNDFYTEGDRFVTRVVDNGSGSKAAPDQISFTYFARSFECVDYAEANFQFEMLDLTAGQVIVR